MADAAALNDWRRVALAGCIRQSLSGLLKVPQSWSCVAAAPSSKWVMQSRHCASFPETNTTMVDVAALVQVRPGLKAESWRAQYSEA